MKTPVGRRYFLRLIDILGNEVGRKPVAQIWLPAERDISSANYKKVVVMPLLNTRHNGAEARMLIESPKYMLLESKFYKRFCKPEHRENTIWIIHRWKIRSEWTFSSKVFSLVPKEKLRKWDVKARGFDFKVTGYNQQRKKSGLADRWRPPRTYSTERGVATKRKKNKTSSKRFVTYEGPQDEAPEDRKSEGEAIGLLADDESIGDTAASA